MLNSDFACASVLISYGALLGKSSPIQLMVMALIEIVIFTINEHIGLNVLNVGFHVSIIKELFVSGIICK
jgi:ammonium transporter Rh